MKLFVVALSLVAICSAISVDDIDKDKKFSQECADELGMTSAQFEKYERNIENFVDEPKAQIYVKCGFRKFGWIDQNGDFQESGVIKTFSTGDIDVITEEQVKQCIATAGDNTTNEFPIKLVACCKTKMLTLVRHV